MQYWTIFSSSLFLCLCMYGEKQQNTFSLPNFIACFLKWLNGCSHWGVVQVTTQECLQKQKPWKASCLCDHPRVLSDSLMSRLCNFLQSRLSHWWKVNSRSWQIRQSFELIQAQTEKIRPADRRRWGEMCFQLAPSVAQGPRMHHVLHMRISQCLAERETCYF